MLPVRMSFWERVVADGYRVPHGAALDELTTELVGMLGNPDPRVREDIAFSILATWTTEGVYDDLLSGLGDGLLVGLLSGALTFIPYVGVLVGTASGLLIATFQYDSWLMVAVVFGVFMVGQFLESSFVTPKLVGDRVGLHPVWMIFAVMAGGAVQFLESLDTAEQWQARKALLRAAAHISLVDPA